MRLTLAQVQQVQDQIDAQAVPTDHPTANQLEQVFGGHTFFIGPNGLHVVEAPPPEDNVGGTAALIKLAEWGDDARTELVPKSAEFEGAIELEAGGRSNGEK